MILMRRMGRRAAVAALVLGLGAGFAGSMAYADERPVVVSTFSVVGDMVRHVGGELVDARVLTPVGDEVHAHELRPGNFVALEQASLVLVNGYMLEQWMDQVEATVRPGVPVIAVAEATGWPTIPIQVGDLAGDPDPHLWMHPEAAGAYVDVIRRALVDLLPEHEATFADAAARYTASIEAAAAEARALLDAVPADRRLLLSTEAAFLYFADAFGWRHDAVWGSNAESGGTPAQLRRVLDRVRAEAPPAIFFESTVSDRHVRAIASDTGVRVAGPLYVDSVSAPGGEAETYPAMLLANARTIHAAIAEE